MRKQSRKGWKKIVTNIYCAFGQHFHWIIIDTFSTSKLLFCCFCHPLILQFCLFNLSIIPIHQKDVVTNSLIKREAWKTMIYNGNISFQARAIKMEFKLYWVLWYKITPRKDFRASKTQKILVSKPEQLYMWESSESVSDTSALFKVLLSTDFF